MPCQGPSPEEEHFMAAAAHKQKIAALICTNDKLVNMLCRVMKWATSHCTNVEPWGEIFLKDNKDIRQWWAKHNDLDIARVGMNKLSKKERIALAKYIKEHGALPPN